MRRRLILLLLAFLPLQFSWAAVTTYCQHEAGSSAAHLGHHEREQRAAVDHELKVDTAVDSEVATEADSDCGHCHCHGHCHCVALHSLAGPLPGIPAAAPQRTAADVAHGAHASTRPERPQWARLA